MGLIRDEEDNVINCCDNCIYFKPVLRRCDSYIGAIIIRQCYGCRRFFPKTE